MRSLMKTMPERDSQLMTQWVCYIPCECGRTYNGKTGRPLALRPREHEHSLQEGILEK
jgi:hypothetical protein